MPDHRAAEEGGRPPPRIRTKRPPRPPAAQVTVNKTLERARNELPPLPPPLSSGWRPVPSVGSDSGWMQDGGAKRQREGY